MSNELHSSLSDLPSTGVRRAFAVLAALGLAAGAHAQTDVVDEIMDVQAQTESAARESQVRIAQLDEEASSLLGEYRQVVAEADNLVTYNQQLRTQVESQQEEIDAMLRQLEEIETTSSQVMPMMQRMLETLETFVSLDVPFLRGERQARIDNLNDIMRRADVTVSEKYRRIVEAYGVEMEYGRTIEAYRDEITNGDEPRTVDALRIGRVALMYQTLDGAETGYWDTSRGDWVIDNGYRSAVRQGLRVAREQTAPTLMFAPVPSPEEGEL